MTGNLPSAATAMADQVAGIWIGRCLTNRTIHEIFTISSLPPAQGPVQVPP